MKQCFVALSEQGNDLYPHVTEESAKLEFQTNGDSKLNLLLWSCL